MLPNIQLHPGELIIDGFAGGGGASLGIEIALGRGPDIAINHDPKAIAMHTANHPHTKHYCESIYNVSPRKVVAGRPVGLAWFSPDCRHHSKAKGGKPVDKQIRGLAWMAKRWAADVKPRMIFVENVIEFEDWGPLLSNNKPCKLRKGVIFRRWLQSFRDLGYRIEYRRLRACDYGAPTTRQRLFIIARCDGLPIVWPEPSHGPGRAHQHRSAAECIDWSIPTRSIFGRKKSLAENTLRRTGKGIWRYVIEDPNPFILRLGHTGHGDGGKVRGIKSPLSTITSKNEHCLVTPVLAELAHGEKSGSERRPVNILEPATTIMAGGNKFALISAFLVKHYEGVVGKSIEKPIDTITAIDHHSLVTAHIQRDFGQSVGHAIENPLGTITADGGGKAALAISHLVKLRGDTKVRKNSAQSLREPAPTLTAGGLHIAECRAFLVKYYGTGSGQALGEPLHTITSNDRFGLVHVQGSDYVIADICLRMLEPRELFLAQGFPASYKIFIKYGSKFLSKRDQVKMVGNSVSPPIAAALVLANAGAQMALGPSIQDWEPGMVPSGQQMSLFDLAELLGAS